MAVFERIKLILDMEDEERNVFSWLIPLRSLFNDTLPPMEKELFLK